MEGEALERVIAVDVGASLQNGARDTGKGNRLDPRCGRRRCVDSDPRVLNLNAQSVGRDARSSKEEDREFGSGLDDSESPRGHLGV